MYNERKPPGSFVFTSADGAVTGTGSVASRAACSRHRHGLAQSMSTLTAEDVEGPCRRALDASRGIKWSVRLYSARSHDDSSDDEIDARDEEAEATNVRDVAVDSERTKNPDSEWSGFVVYPDNEREPSPLLLHPTLPNSHTDAFDVATPVEDNRNASLALLCPNTGHSKRRAGTWDQVHSIRQKLGTALRFQWNCAGSVHNSVIGTESVPSDVDSDCSEDDDERLFENIFPSQRLWYSPPPVVPTNSSPSSQRSLSKTRSRPFRKARSGLRRVRSGVQKCFQGIASIGKARPRRSIDRGSFPVLIGPTEASTPSTGAPAGSNALMMSSKLGHCISPVPHPPPARSDYIYTELA